LYIVVLNKDIKKFRIKREEVEAIKWFSREELIKKLDDNPEKFLKVIKDCLDWFRSTEKLPASYCR